MKESKKNDEELVIVVNPEDLDKINQISENYQFFKEIRKSVNNYNKRFRRDFADLFNKGNKYIGE